MEQLASQLQGGERIAAQDDFDKVMRVMNELNKQANKKVLVGELKIGLGRLMVVGTGATAVYEQWGPIRRFLSGGSHKVPTFLDILPKSDSVVIHLEPR